MFTDKPYIVFAQALSCRRAFNFDHLCSLNFDQV